MAKARKTRSKKTESQADTDTFVAVGDQGDIQSSTDGGETWAQPDHEAEHNAADVTAEVPDTMAPEESDVGARWLPPMPSSPELTENGFSEDEAEVIIRKMTELHEELDGLKSPPPMKLVPGLSIRAKRPNGFWICGHQIKPDQPWEVAVEALSDENRREIDTVKDFLSIEETEVEVPE